MYALWKYPGAYPTMTQVGLVPGTPGTTGLFLALVGDFEYVNAA